MFDAAAVARVVEAAFGPGRLAKTAERLREGRDPAVGYVARQDGRIIGSVRLWTITIGGALRFPRPYRRGADRAQRRHRRGVGRHLRELGPGGPGGGCPAGG
ncbi:hypothetical protein [Brevundimonas denitrificans]|uniref:hypothetical protein n=1 Tax=Brevundimonas denitrificans TaxID=1443434 RepID=UPI00223BAD5D|nr:hypothetical protein [Brevundimonas denitrificans]